ncbi:cytochrome P450 [Streptomyces sp. NPDC007205]|uniref:cytochrome P450 n=1 Tax=Streptomyces sp. NPDC007205 TaxID=3154316 RepID=UPI0033CCDFE2
MTEYTFGSAPRALPLLGHASHLLRDPYAFLASLSQHGDLVRIQLGAHQAIVVCHPELTHQLLVDDRTFDKGGPLVDRGRELFGDSLAICRYAQHRRQRKLIQPAFHQVRLADYAATMTAVISKMTGQWQDGALLDMRAQMRAYTSQVVATTMFGGALGAADRDRALHDLSTLLAGTYIRMFLPKALTRVPTPGNRAYEQARVRLRTVLGQLIDTYRRTGVDHGDALSMLLSAKDENGQQLTSDEIIDQIVILFIAGSDTTANTLSWAVHLLGRHPTAEQRLHEECAEVLHRRPAAFADLDLLPWTRNIITETLRLYPPAALITRTVTTDTTLGGHRILQGSTIIYSSLAVQHRHDLYPEPEAFAPERWSEPAPHPPRGALTPFGGGPRICIGDKFGMTMAVLGLASIAANWHLHPHPPQVLPVLRTFLAPRDLRMTVHRRT